MDCDNQKTIGKQERKKNPILGDMIVNIKKKSHGIRSVAELEECLPSMQETLSLIPILE